MYTEVKDSGKRSEFATGANRDSVEGKGRYDLLPAYAVKRIAQHFENGAKKYDDDNWRKGIPLRRFLDSALRHMFNYLEGQRDEDHAAAAAWNILAMMETEEMIRRGIVPASLNELPDWTAKTAEPAKAIETLTTGACTYLGDGVDLEGWVDQAFKIIPEWMAGDENELMAEAYLQDDSGHTLIETDASTRWVMANGQSFASPSIAYIERDGLTMTYWKWDGTIASIYIDKDNSFQSVIEQGYYVPYHGPMVRLACDVDLDACGCGVVMTEGTAFGSPVSCRDIEHLIRGAK